MLALWDWLLRWGLVGGADVRPDLGACLGDDGEAQLVVFESDPGYFSER